SLPEGLSTLYCFCAHAGRQRAKRSAMVIVCLFIVFVFNVFICMLKVSLGITIRRRLHLSPPRMYTDCVLPRTAPRQFPRDLAVRQSAQCPIARVGHPGR